MCCVRWCIIPLSSTTVNTAKSVGGDSGVQQVTKWAGRLRSNPRRRRALNPIRHHLITTVDFNITMLTRQSTAPIHLDVTHLQDTRFPETLHEAPITRESSPRSGLNMLDVACVGLALRRSWIVDAARAASVDRSAASGIHRLLCESGGGQGNVAPNVLYNEMSRR